MHHSTVHNSFLYILWMGKTVHEIYEWNDEEEEKEAAAKKTPMNEPIFYIHFIHVKTVVYYAYVYKTGRKYVLTV